MFTTQTYQQLELVNLRNLTQSQLSLFDLWRLRDEAEEATHEVNTRIWADYQAKQYQLPLINQEVTQ